MDANPLNTVNLRKFLQKFGKSASAVEVKTVVGRILGNDYQFPDTLGCKLFSFLHENFNRN